MAVNRRITLAARPVGAPKDSDFRMVEEPVPEPGPGQFLARVIYLSLDPYMRGRMSDGPSYATPVGIGDVMVGGTVAQVVTSNNPEFSEGSFVLGMFGWQEYALSDGAGVRKLDPRDGPLSLALGTLGMPGMTAWYGLTQIGQPKAGETVVVSAAAGAVGSVVGQLAKARGARAVGIAGGADKCRLVTEHYGFDACVDYKAPDFPRLLAEACPDGVDVYFENVGGAVTDAVLKRLNTFARVPVCGTIAHYNDEALPPGPNRMPLLMRLILVKRLRVEGFIVSDHFRRTGEFLREVAPMLRDGRIQVKEDIVEGIGNAVSAFQGLLQGRNVGKLLVRVSPDPTR